MENFDFGDREETGNATPSSVTILVSLFLILITFFVIINNSASQNVDRKSIALDSLQEKFGKPTDQAINFGGMLQPKPESFILEIEKLLGDEAKIQSTLNGDEVMVISTKDNFYFADESGFKPVRLDTVIKLQEILMRWNKTAELKITFVLGLEDFERDKARLENFRQIMPLSNVNVGLDPDYPGKFAIVIKYSDSL